MPGLTIIHQPAGDRPTGASSWTTFQRLAAPLLYDERFTAEKLLEAPGLLIAATRYPQYPITVFEASGFTIILEGRIYSHAGTALREALTDLARRLAHSAGEAGGEDPAAWLPAWLLGVDGDFVLVIHETAAGRTFILNDALGRLPLYRAAAGDGVVLTREFRLLPALTEADRTDRMGVAEYLLFGYPLAERTLLEGAARLPGAALTVLQPGEEASPETRILHRFNFEPKDDGTSAEAWVEELAGLFQEACQRRDGAPAGLTNLLLMSGGLDSRAVAGGFQASGVAMQGATYLSPGGGNRGDLDGARQLTGLMGIPWRDFELTAPTGADLARLHRAKFGMNFLEMAPRITFLRALMAAFGPAGQLLTGDGGDKALPDLRPPKRLRRPTELLDFVVAKSYQFSMADAARLAGLPEADLSWSVINQLESYPESDPNQKFVHFLIAERAGKWLFEGEDRDRFHFWNATPFYAMPFFLRAMVCPDRFKAGYDLYVRFLKRLSPKTVEVGYADFFGAPIGSARFRAVRWLKGTVQGSAHYEQIRRFKRVLARRGSGSEPGPLERCLLAQIAHCRQAGDDALDWDYAARVVGDRGRHGKREFYNLLTVAATVEALRGAGSSLDDFSSEAFR